MSTPEPHDADGRLASIRSVVADDMPALRAIIEATGLFPSDLLGDMIGGFLAGSADEEHWLTFDDGGPAGLAYVAPERMTQGTWNVLLMAVHPDRQGQGLGGALLAHIEQMLAASGGRVLLVETSGLPAFEQTRRFYWKCGYEEEARIREFYQAGEDKIIFRKRLAGAP